MRSQLAYNGKAQWVFTYALNVKMTTENAEQIIIKKLTR